MTRREGALVFGLALLGNGYGSALFVGAIRTAAIIWGVPWPGDLMGLLVTWLVMTIATSAATVAAYLAARGAVTRLVAAPGPGVAAGVLLGTLAGPLNARWLVLAMGLGPSG